MPSQPIKRFVKFNAIFSLGLILSVVILNIEFNRFRMNRYLGNSIAIMVVSLWNYLTNRKFNWRVTVKE